MSARIKKENIDYGLRIQNDSGNGSDGARFRLFDAVVLVALLLVFSVVVTQEFAKMMGYHSLLGAPLYRGFYAPWGYLSWVYQFDLFGNPQAQDVLKKYGALFVLLFGLYVVFVVHLRKKTRLTPDESHGSARYAGMGDVVRMGLTDNDGVVLGAYEQDGRRVILCHDGPEHVLMVAPTGSGKGVSVVNPTLLSWPGSIVVYDLKRENWSLSSQWRKDYGNNVVLRFEPACSDGTAASYNPLSEVRLGTFHDVQDVQNIAAIIMDYGDESAGKSNDYFVSAGYQLLVAYLLHTCYLSISKNGVYASLPDVADAMSDPELNYEQLMETMTETYHLDDKPHPICQREGRQMINMIQSGATKQFAGIFDSVRSNLSLYADPVVKQNIGHSDFKIMDLMNHDQPVSLYICVGSTDKTRLRPLTKLLFSQIIRTLTAEVKYSDGISTPDYKHKLLLLIDEFPSLGKMSIMNEAIAFLRGYGIKCLLIIQDFTQLRDSNAYGRDEAITANCGVRIAFAPNTVATAKEISEMVGSTTITNFNVSVSSSAKILAGAGNNRTLSTLKRPLLTPDEVMRLRTVRKKRNKIKGTDTMDAGDSLVFLVGEPVIYGRQILHFQDPVFSKRAALGALDKSDKLTPLYSA